MGVETGIAWTDHTFNPWWGCQRVSPGCEHCYAETWDRRWGGEHWGPKAERRFFGDAHWNEPRKWNRDAEKAGVRRRVFCASMADVFEARPDVVPARLSLWKLIDQTPYLDWQILTKRPENAAAMLPWVSEPWPNVWLGTTVEDQQRADERIPHLLRTPAAVRFLSCEPLLGAVDLRLDEQAVDWVIVGGESGAGARPMPEDLAFGIVEQCYHASVACFVKQLGGVHDKRGEPAFWPAYLRVREFPADCPTPITAGPSAPSSKSKKGK